MKTDIGAEFLIVRDFARDMVTLSFEPDDEATDAKRVAFLKTRAPVAIDAAMNLICSLFINIERIADALDGGKGE